MPGIRVATLCSVVRLTSLGKKTSIRTDRSASQGNAYESTAAARLLFTSTTALKIGDLVDIGGLNLIVESIQQRRHNLTGLIDHLQVDLSVYGS